ncbi:MAG TPA: hypothetical protein VJ901_03075 [Thermoanaerobaculia bacterium]|nr:hypothetical protein [Thermoanaerobaculia bacterium]
MKVHRLESMRGGWFVGQFEPTVLASSDFEVAIKSYKAGTKEDAHVHRVATELTAIVTGEAKLNDFQLGPGDIIEIPPGEAAAFEALTDVTTVVVKVPSVPGDKYFV